MKTFSVWTITAVFVGMSATSGWALFESNKELSSQARIGMAEAVKIAEQNTHGKAVEAGMGKDEGRVVYKIETIDSTNKTQKVYVDAMDGKIHEIK
jgi:uncharacterized membrane protein YkoI